MLNRMFSTITKYRSMLLKRRAPQFGTLRKVADLVLNWFSVAVFRARLGDGVRRVADLERRRLSPRPARTDGGSTLTRGLDHAAPENRFAQARSALPLRMVTPFEPQSMLKTISWTS